MRNHPIQLDRPRAAIIAQFLLMVMVILLAEFVPRPGQPALYFPVLHSGQTRAVTWALNHGAAINGRGPMGGVILTSAPAGLVWRALSEGALVIQIPSIICLAREARIHG